jgi:FtsZ-binding cell division protein ZapB
MQEVINMNSLEVFNNQLEAVPNNVEDISLLVNQVDEASMNLNKVAEELQQLNSSMYTFNKKYERYKEVASDVKIKMRSIITEL